RRIPRHGRPAVLVHRPARRHAHRRGGDVAALARPRPGVPQGGDRRQVRAAALPGGGAGRRAGAGRAASGPGPGGVRGVRIGYLGPPGTFAEEALLTLVGPGADVEPVPYPSVVDSIEAVARGEVPEALVPIENSIEGSVNQTIDQLAFGGAGVLIRAEVVHPVSHHLIAR